MHKLEFSAHGHFYQPPREDPFTNQIPEEFGAAPYGNWTEKIYRECYLPNANHGNFEKISFNIGPTLMIWLQQEHPETYRAIINQEAMVRQRIGVSNAMAQPFFHIIMPLASDRDKLTMVKWGIKAFQKDFGHKPQGMWLPETAVDLPTLKTLSDCGIEFTILAPWQSQDPHLDVTRPYRVPLPEGGYMIVFFYHAHLSSEISFNPSASENADTFVQNWLIPQAEMLRKDRAQFLIAASDGELYGHHHPFRDQFLSYLLDGAVENANIKHTFSALWLRDHEVEEEIHIIENTSWSCHHGIERWRNVCGDAPTATWKKPLREFMNALSSSIDLIFEESLHDYLDDPWSLRDDYADVLVGSQVLSVWLEEKLGRHLPTEENEHITLLLKAQFERLRMLSSDAWFFYDLDRIEPLNALKYAAHAVHLVEQATGKDPSKNLIDIISQARSELSGLTGDMAFLGYLKKFELQSPQSAD